jgi:hypothetical protein
LQPAPERVSTVATKRVSDTELFDLMHKSQLTPDEYKKWQN